MNFASVVMKQVLVMRWKPNLDLVAVALSWLLVVGALSTATRVIGADNGIGYFLLYGVVGATLFGICLPLFWMVAIRRRPLADLGLTTRRWELSIALQLVFAGLQYAGTLGRTELPPFTEFLPLVALALSIGLFEAIFWRGWVLLRLEEAFGLIPAVLLGSALYAAYHVGYGMTSNEIIFLFFVGILFGMVFRLTKSVLVLWPFFQPMGQLVTMIKDGLSLPFLASLGFAELLVVMIVIIVLTKRYQRRRVWASATSKGNIA